MGIPNHVIVLMFENRSFDHMLGFLPGIGDLTGEEYNLVDPANPESERVYVSEQVGPNAVISPNHEFVDVQEQLFGDGVPVESAPMSGFVLNASKISGIGIDQAKLVMECQSPNAIPVLSRLASEYAACTRWFSSVPGPTYPNRYYVHAATSAGLVTDSRLGTAVVTIQEKLAEAKKTWRVYAGDVPQCLAIESLLRQLVEDLLSPFSYHHFHGLAQFFADLKGGSLPNYSFIEPHYFQTALWHASDEHPPHDLKYGEMLLSAVVSSLAQSDYWEDSLLVVLFDEHGGFYDQVSPPTGVPNPDGRVSGNPAFDFSRLGIRVPAVLVSPFIDVQTIDATVYEHASVPATLNKLFNLGPENFLTARDRAANTFERNVQRSQPRSAIELQWASAYAQTYGDEIELQNVQIRRAIGMIADEMLNPKHVLSDFQKSLFGLVRSILVHL